MQQLIEWDVNSSIDALHNEHDSLSLKRLGIAKRLTTLQRKRECSSQRTEQAIIKQQNLLWTQIQDIDAKLESIQAKIYFTHGSAASWEQSSLQHSKSVKRS
jgi:hypothetical protein